MRILRNASGRSLLLVIAMLLVMALAPAAASADADGLQDELAEIRAATAKYHRVEVALADGYELGYNGLITHCVAHPTDGAMGYHYFNAELMEDPAEDPLRPEGLVYAPGRNGQLKLVAVEWVVPGEVWDATGNDGAPSVLGMDLHVLNPALGWWIMHAWVWKHNPSGMFEDWNPAVACP